MVTSLDTPANTSAAKGEAVVAVDVLDRILDRLDRMERKLDRLSAPAEVGPRMLAAATDTVDAWSRSAQARGLDIDASLAAGVRVLERAAEPATAARIEALLGRLDAVEDALNFADQVPGMVATLGDMVDALARRAQAQGVDLDATLRTLTPLLATLSDPRVLQAIETLTRQAPELASLVDQGPKLVAAAVDSVDGLMGRMTARGVDVQAMSESVAVALTKLGELLNSPQYKALMNSGVLDPNTLEMVGKAGSALVHARIEACAETGLFGALRATSDKDIQRAIGFAIKFAHAFGQELGQPDNLKHLAAVGEKPARLPAP